MKIGIITFHWATNYGAVLQAYAMQEYLKSCGHMVEIINYKPSQYDFSAITYLKHPRKIKYLYRDIKFQKKESDINRFRIRYLNLTKRFFRQEELFALGDKYDVLISGSDQILNPSFTLKGEGCPTSSYFLSFDPSTKRIGYAVSFGCEIYPERSLKFAREWINNFDVIGYREHSGKKILEQMNYGGLSTMVPDPTILVDKELIEKLVLREEVLDAYTYIYMLRGKTVICRDSVLGTKKRTEGQSKVCSVNNWVSDIANARYVITNSFHCVVMCLLFHVKFAVILETSSSAGMNDRVYTLLERVNLTNHISINGYDEIESVLQKEVDWDMVDRSMAEYSDDGRRFLESYL